jgi:hypothetical protein
VGRLVKYSRNFSTGVCVTGTGGNVTIPLFYGS